MLLYKFIEQKHLDSFFRNGALRLGTVHGFRDTLEYGDARGDGDEGRHAVRRVVNNTLRITAGQNEPLISDFIKITGEKSSLELTNCEFVQNHQSPDAFIFCTSYEFSEPLFREWYGRDKLDACYQIVDVNGFASAISRKIATSAWYAGNTNVIYRDAYIDYTSPHASVSPGLTKLRAKYAWQKENRMVWNSFVPSPPLTPWIIEVPEASRFCKPYSAMRDGRIVYTTARAAEPAL